MSDTPAATEEKQPVISPIIAAKVLGRPTPWSRLQRLALEIEPLSIVFRLAGCLLVMEMAALVLTCCYDVPGSLTTIAAIVASGPAWRRLETFVQTRKIRQYTIHSITKGSESEIPYHKALALLMELRNYKLTLVDLSDVASSIAAQFASTAIPSDIAGMLAKAVRDQVKEALEVATIGLEQSIELAAGRAKRTYRGALIIAIGAVGVPVVAGLTYAGAIPGLQPEAMHALLGNWHVLAFATGAATMFRNRFEDPILAT
jgi:hypothetical protein